MKRELYRKGMKEVYPFSISDKIASAETNKPKKKVSEKTILLVEDDGLLRKSLKTILENDYGYNVMEFSDGTAAIRTIAETKPQIDAAILDIVMHGHGGSVGKYLKTIPKYEQISIIYYSGLEQNQFNNDILEGAYFINKEKGSVKQVCEILKKFLG